MILLQGTRILATTPSCTTSVYTGMENRYEKQKSHYQGTCNIQIIYT